MANIMLLIMQSMYFFLPAYIANMAPVLIKKVPLLAMPVHEKLFGSHKTWRGLMIAPVVGGLVFFFQKVAYEQGFRSLAIIDYADFSLAFGILMGAGAIVGDLIKSYYKRKEGIAPGKPWILYDQLDFVIGGIIGAAFVYVPRAEVTLTLLIVSPPLHFLFNYIGYLLHINDTKY